MPITIYRQKLSHVPLCPSTVRLHQYDGSMLPTKGEIDVVISSEQQTVAGKFVIVDITNDQLPLLGRDWLLKLRLDWPIKTSWLHGSSQGRCHGTQKQFS